MSRQEFSLKRKISIFYVTNKREEGFTKSVKKYIHPIDVKLNAEFRSLKADQIIANKQVENETTAYFIVNRRYLENNWYIEYDRRDWGLQTYQILGIDPWDDNPKYLKLSVKLINSPIKFDVIEGSDFKC